jgi:hypothetical protein
MRGIASVGYVGGREFNELVVYHGIYHTFLRALTDRDAKLKSGLLPELL